MQHRFLPYTHDSYTWIVPGQPVPAPRMNRASARLEGVNKRYYLFRDLVRTRLVDTYPHEGILAINILNRGVPFVFATEGRGPRAQVDYWLNFACASTGNCTHGDADNIVKTLMDALFAQDRHVMPRCMGITCAVPEPSLRITLTLLQQESMFNGDDHYYQYFSRRHGPTDRPAGRLV